MDMSSDEELTSVIKRPKIMRFESDSDLPQADASSDSDVLIVDVVPSPSTLSKECDMYKISDCESDESEASIPTDVIVMDIAKSPIKTRPKPHIPVKSVQNLHGLINLPIFSQPSKLLSTQEGLNVLLSSELQDRDISTRVPFGVGINSVFIVDISHLKSHRDLLCDDMGVWRWKGSFHKWCSVDEEGFVKILGPELVPTDDPDEAAYRVWKRYYSLQSSPDVRRMAIMLENHNCEMLNLALLQYLFTEGEHEVKVAPHGNSKRKEPYIRTMPSMLKTMKSEAKQNTAKRVLQFVKKQSGGLLKAKSAGELPRSRQQVHDYRRCKKDDDPLYTVMYMCKEGENGGENMFIRMVNAAPYPMMILALDHTLNDLVRFCTTPECFSVLGVDPTFNLGDFDVTVTTYRHQLLRSQGNLHGKPPVMMGPLFIHVKKNFSTYHFFASSLIGMKRELSMLQAFGTDGEEALENAMSTAFANAVHVRCFLHFRDNIKRKLQSLNLPCSVVESFVDDVMGKPSQLQLGLVDCENVAQLDLQLKQAEDRWNNLEQPFNNPPLFHTWFMRHCRDNVAKYMIRDVRVRAGLGNPPDPFYTVKNGELYKHL